MTDTRCDAGGPNGKRCKNKARFWIVLKLQPNETEVEEWPVAVCDHHSKPAGIFHRMGPDRREDYKNREQVES